MASGGGGQPSRGSSRTVERRHGTQPKTAAVTTVAQPRATAARSRTTCHCLVAMLIGWAVSGQAVQLRPPTVDGPSRPRHTTPPWTDGAARTQRQPQPQNAAASRWQPRERARQQMGWDLDVVSGRWVAAYFPIVPGPRDRSRTRGGGRGGSYRHHRAPPPPEVAASAAYDAASVGGSKPPGGRAKGRHRRGLGRHQGGPAPRRARRLSGRGAQPASAQGGDLGRSDSRAAQSARRSRDGDGAHNRAHSVVRSLTGRSQAAAGRYAIGQPISGELSTGGSTGDGFGNAHRIDPSPLDSGTGIVGHVARGPPGQHATADPASEPGAGIYVTGGAAIAGSLNGTENPVTPPRRPRAGSGVSTGPGAQPDGTSSDPESGQSYWPTFSPGTRCDEPGRRRRRPPHRRGKGGSRRRSASAHGRRTTRRRS